MKVTKLDVWEYQQLKAKEALEYRNQIDESQRYYCYKPYRTLKNY